MPHKPRCKLQGTNEIIENIAGTADFSFKDLSQYKVINSNKTVKELLRIMRDVKDDKNKDVKTPSQKTAFNTRYNL